MASLSEIFACLGWLQSSNSSQSQGDDDDQKDNELGTSSSSKYEGTTFIEVIFAHTDLVVTIFDRKQWALNCHSWRKFTEIPDAVNAATEAGYSYEQLQNASNAVYEGRYKNGTVEKLCAAAQQKRSERRHAERSRLMVQYPVSELR
ncbi:uncharacterized protein TRUGW13939_11558 [Talaromyces rugulosus]|uniref:Uncharacterized protein n=1 Tax=Talaromyces rugulosus TaxID=121627 RepID=A0A7H8RD77_TALRU|nr:uncharacterized protein TRUGW13939_11558 [Talaromyces rugulosus]QKX64384.1 hypothetical protein TRUGW13939_11558 [Talaromyces rugulosus]